MGRKKLLWIIVTSLLILVICGLFALMGSGMVGMIRAHLGM